MKKQIAQFGIAAILAGPALGAERPFDAAPQEAVRLQMPEMGDDIGVQTRIATRTKLNIDYAPGTVTVLYGEDVLAKGARIVWEALSLVPGFDLSHDETGTRQVLVRGVGRTYSSGNIKILLNDVAQNSELLSLANPVLNMPVEQVERIEVIRGPGSAIYGESAYMGVVNVITRKDGQRVFGALASRNTQTGGAVLSLDKPEQQFDMSLNVGTWQRQGGGLHTGQDALYAEGQGGLSNASGTVNDKRDFQSALFNLNYQKFSLTAQWLEDGAGDYFGINNFLPPDDRRIVTTQRHRSLELKQLVDIADSLQAEFKLGWGDFTHTRDRLFSYPVGYTSTSGYAFGNTEPIYFNRDYRESRLTAGADLAYETKQHTLLFGWGFNRVRITDENLNSAFFGVLPWVSVGRQRIISSYTLQDEFRASDALTITAGLRNDQYDDVGSSTTPRLAAVWQMMPGHLIKAQYAEAFRAPTFYEQRFGATIKPETIATRELGYIYKGGRTNGRATLFDSSLKNLIVLDATVSNYFNRQLADSQGMELELEHWYGNALKLDGNLSFNHTTARDTGADVPGAAKWLANAGLEWRASQDASLDFRLRHVGSRSREATDPRGRLGSYESVDVTARVFNLGYRGLTLHAGVKNLFDQDIRIPALLDERVTSPSPTYPDDYPQPGREAWAELTYSF